MAGSLTVYGRNALLNGTAMPATLYLQQHTGAPGSAGTSNVSTDCASGTRKAFTRTTSTVGTNENVEVLDVNITVSETLSHWSAFDANSGGNCWWTGDWNSARSYVNGDIARVKAGDLDLSIT